jgi:hypothetical protein
MEFKIIEQLGLTIMIRLRSKIVHNMFYRRTKTGLSGIEKILPQEGIRR